jgi:hypothetical protein
MRDEMTGPFPRANMMYDEPFPSSSGPRSLNDAIRAAAFEMKAYRGETILLDAAELMRDWHAHLSGAFRISAYWQDQIHLNVWGQMKLVGALLATAWPGVELSITSIERMVAESWKRLGYASSNEHWSADAAVDQLRRALIANDSQRYCQSAG